MLSQHDFESLGILQFEIWFYVVGFDARGGGFGETFAALHSLG